MICVSFKTVVYPVGLVWFRMSWISRTVEGPWSHNTRRISSSPSVGRLEDLRMAGSYYEIIRSVNEILRRLANETETANSPCVSIRGRGCSNRSAGTFQLKNGG